MPSTGNDGLFEAMSSSSSLRNGYHQQLSASTAMQPRNHHFNNDGNFRDAAISSVINLSAGAANSGNVSAISLVNSSVAASSNTGDISTISSNNLSVAATANSGVVSEQHMHITFGCRRGVGHDQRRNANHLQQVTTTRSERVSLGDRCVVGTFQRCCNTENHHQSATTVNSDDEENCDDLSIELDSRNQSGASAALSGQRDNERNSDDLSTERNARNEPTFVHDSRNESSFVIDNTISQSNHCAIPTLRNPGRQDGLRPCSAGTEESRVFCNNREGENNMTSEMRLLRDDNLSHRDTTDPSFSPCSGIATVNATETNYENGDFPSVHTRATTPAEGAVHNITGAFANPHTGPSMGFPDNPGLSNGEAWVDVGIEPRGSNPVSGRVANSGLFPSRNNIASNIRNIQRTAPSLRRNQNPPSVQNFLNNLHLYYTNDLSDIISLFDKLLDQFYCEAFLWLYVTVLLDASQRITRNRLRFLAYISNQTLEQTLNTTLSGFISGFMHSHQAIVSDIRSELRSVSASGPIGVEQSDWLEQMAVDFNIQFEPRQMLRSFDTVVYNVLFWRRKGSRVSRSFMNR